MLSDSLSARFCSYLRATKKQWFLKKILSNIFHTPPHLRVRENSEKWLFSYSENSTGFFEISVPFRQTLCISA